MKGKAIAFAAVLLILVGVFIRWGQVPVGIQTLELFIRPVIQKESVDRYAKLYNEDPLFITSVIKVESNFLKHARSPRGAMGLMQIMPATGAEMAKELEIKNFTPESLADPKINIRIGTYYLSKLRRELGPDSVAVLAAYNAGGKNAREWMKNKKTLDVDDIEFPETRKFVAEVLSTHRLLQRLQMWRDKIVNFSKPKAA